MPITIQFEVEDGTGKADATAYITLDEFRQYWINRGVDYTDDTTYPDNTIKAWINIASEYLDNAYQTQFKGVKYDDDQAMQFPRVPERISTSPEVLSIGEIYDSRQDKYIAYNEIPQTIKDAAAIMAREADLRDKDVYGSNDGISSRSLKGRSVSYTSFRANGMIEYRAVTAVLKGILRAGNIRRV